VFTECLANEELVKSIVTAADTSKEEFRIDISPSFVINGTMYAGYLSLEDLQAILDPLIAAAEAVRPVADDDAPAESGGFPSWPIFFGVAFVGLVVGTYVLRKSKSANV